MCMRNFCQMGIQEAYTQFNLYRLKSPIKRKTKLSYGKIIYASFAYFAIGAMIYSCCEGTFTTLEGMEYVFYSEHEEQEGGIVMYICTPVLPVTSLFCWEAGKRPTLQRPDLESAITSETCVKCAAEIFFKPML
ncbi:hypothetical protein ABZP36_024348 [Zizania latifolia]